MTYETKINEGSLFRNDRKETSAHPDHKGTLNVEGKEYWVSAWVNEAKSTGKKYFKLSIKAKDDQAAPAPKTDDFLPDEDIPF